MAKDLSVVVDPGEKKGEGFPIVIMRRSMVVVVVARYSSLTSISARNFVAPKFPDIPPLVRLLSKSPTTSRIPTIKMTGLKQEQLWIIFGMKLAISVSLQFERALCHSLARFVFHFYQYEGARGLYWRQQPVLPSYERRTGYGHHQKETTL